MRLMTPAILVPARWGWSLYTGSRVSEDALVASADSKEELLTLAADLNLDITEVSP